MTRINAIVHAAVGCQSGTTSHWHLSIRPIQHSLGEREHIIATHGGSAITQKGEQSD